MESSLPDDVLQVIATYLEGYKQPLFKFRLCSKARLEKVLKVLRRVGFFGTQKPFPSSFVGAKPQSVIIHDFVHFEKETSALVSLLASATDLELNCPLDVIGPSLSTLTSLKCLHASVNMDSVIDWFPFVANLENFVLRAEHVSPLPIVEALSQNCQHLKRLELADTYFSVEDLSPHLNAMKSLTSLTLSSECNEINRLYEFFSGKATFETNEAIEKVLAQLSSLLPPQLCDLNNVFVSVKPHGAASPPLNILAYFYLAAPADKVADFFFEKLKNLPVPQGPLDWTIVLSHCLILDSKNPSRLKKLLKTGIIDLWTPMEIKTYLDEQTVPGNIFHFALQNAPPSVVEELFSQVDWSKTDLEMFRTRSGYTPLHLVPASAATWEAFYAVFSKHFPNILVDSSNMRIATPLLALFSCRGHPAINGVKETHLLQLTKFMLEQRLDLLDDPAFFAHSHLFLFSNVLDVYAHSHSEEVRALLRRLLAHHCRIEGVSHVSQLDATSFRLIEVIHPNFFNLRGPSHIRRNYPLLVLDVDENLFRVLVSHCNQDEFIETIDSALDSGSLPVPKFANIIEMLISIGADINHVSTERGSVLPSYIWRQSDGVTIVGYQRSDQDDARDRYKWDSFWPRLWCLVDHGAKMDGASDQVTRWINEFWDNVALICSHPLDDIVRLSVFFKEHCNNDGSQLLLRIRQRTKPEYPHCAYFCALERVLLRRLGQPLPEGSLSEEEDLKVLGTWDSQVRPSQAEPDCSYW